MKTESNENTNGDNLLSRFVKQNVTILAVKSIINATIISLKWHYSC